MATMTIIVDTKVLEKKTLYKGTTRKIVVSKYYDFNGEIIDQGRDTINYDADASIEIISEKIEHKYGRTDPVIFDVWTLLVNGEKICEDLEITGYKAQKTQLLIEGCIGAG